MWWMPEHFVLMDVHLSRSAAAVALTAPLVLCPSLGVLRPYLVSVIGKMWICCGDDGAGMWVHT